MVDKAEIALYISAKEEASQVLKQVEQQVGLTTQQIRKLGMGMMVSGGIITAAMAAIAGKSLDMGMAAEESENLFTVALGEMAGAAREWSNELADSLDLNQYKLRENVATFYQITSSMGLAKESAYDMSTGLTQLAYDMASFYNLDPTEAFDKLRAGLTGETEPLKRLGILVDENTIKQVAYAEGIAVAGSELTQQEKVLARYAAIMQQTANAQGDLTRTADSATNLKRAIQEMGQEIMTSIGDALVPAFKLVLSAIKPVVSFIKDFTSEHKNLTLAILAGVTAVGAFLVVGGGLLVLITALPPIYGALTVAQGMLTVGTLSNTAAIIKNIASLVAHKAITLVSTGVIKAMAAAQWLLNVAMSANPIGIVIVAIGALVAAGIALYKNWDKVKDWFAELWDNIKIIFSEAVKFLVKTVLQPFFKYIDWIYGTILEVLAKVVGFFKKDWGEAIEGAADVLHNLDDSVVQWADDLGESARASKEARATVKELEASMKEQEESTEQATAAMNEYSDTVNGVSEDVADLTEQIRLSNGEIYQLGEVKEGTGVTSTVTIGGQSYTSTMRGNDWARLNQIQERNTNAQAEISDEAVAKLKAAMTAALSNMKLEVDGKQLATVVSEQQDHMLSRS